jgi:hypothetical protein
LGERKKGMHLAARLNCNLRYTSKQIRSKKESGKNLQTPST